MSGAQPGFRSQDAGDRSAGDRLCRTGRILGEKSPYRPVVTYLSFDREQRKKTRLSCVESLMGTFAVRADFKNGSPPKSEDNANQ